MSTLATTAAPTNSAASRVPQSAPAGPHELRLHQVQAEILDHELELRKMVLAAIEDTLREFENVLPVVEGRHPGLSAYRQLTQDVRSQLAEMKQQATEAALPADLPLPDIEGEAAELLRQNARRAVANHSYFKLFPMLQVLLSNLQPLLLRIAQSDRQIASPLIAAVHAMEASWKKVTGLGGPLAVRRVALTESAPPLASIQKARAFWQEVLQSNPANAYLRSLTPHEGKHGKLRIAYVTIGGLGDALLQTPCIAEIRRRFEPCEIVFVHSRGVVHPLLARNRIVEASVYADDRHILPLPDVLKILGIFDVVFESRFLIWGELCHASRLTNEADLEWIQQTQQLLTTFAPYVERFPQYSNLFARLVSPRMLLAIHGMSTGLPVDVDSPLIICPSETDANLPEELGLVDGEYVTVHDGFDEGFGKAMGLNRCTKQLPIQKWRSLIGGLRRDGLKVVQVGSANEPPLPGTDLDLRGKTSLSQLCFVLKGAAVHIDTEGGIVHMARAVHKRSIVFFGPTSVTFWGYPQNTNLTSEEHVDSWWINFDWMAKSPIAQKRSAMEAFDVTGVPALVAKERAAAHRTYRLEACVLSGPAAPGERKWSDSVAERMVRSDCSTRDARVAVVGQGGDAVLLKAKEVGRTAEIFDIAESGAASRDTSLAGVPVRLGCRYNLPANSSSYDVVVCLEELGAARHRGRALHELLRLLRSGGLLVCTFRVAREPSRPGVTIAEVGRLLRDWCGVEMTFDNGEINFNAQMGDELGTVVLTRTS